MRAPGVSAVHPPGVRSAEGDRTRLTRDGGHLRAPRIVLATCECLKSLK
jgi:hypothetical protein